MVEKHSRTGSLEFSPLQIGLEQTFASPKARGWRLQLRKREMTLPKWLQKFKISPIS